MISNLSQKESSIGNITNIKKTNETLQAYETFLPETYSSHRNNKYRHWIGKYSLCYNKLGKQ